MQLPGLALKHQLTAYDTSYIERALRLKLPIATKDAAMKRAMTSVGIETVKPARDPSKVIHVQASVLPDIRSA
jgi:rRNA-processing protein FCF1